MQHSTLKNILESVLFSADKPIDVLQLNKLFEQDDDQPNKDEIRQALQALQADYDSRGVELKEVAGGYRMQVTQGSATWVSRLWEEKPPRYSRALLETLVLIAYRQPITRGEIEEIRGVSVSSQIVKTLQEREWIRVLGHKDVPGKPAMYGTSREFLDYFNLKSLDEMPTLSEIKDLDKMHPELALDDENIEHGPLSNKPTANVDNVSRFYMLASHQIAASQSLPKTQSDDSVEASNSTDHPLTSSDSAKIAFST